MTWRNDGVAIATTIAPPMTLLTLVTEQGWMKTGEGFAADAWNKGEFEDKNLDETVKELGGGETAACGSRGPGSSRSSICRGW